MEEKNSCYQIMKKRKSVRNYKRGVKIEEEKLLKILDSARIAPSSCNTQPWHIVLVRDEKIKEELSKCALKGTRINKWMVEADLVAVLCGKPHPFLHRGAKLLDRDCHKLDVAIAGEHMVLTAAELGIGSCWIGWFSEKKVRKLLKIPSGVSVIAMITFGYPEEYDLMEERDFSMFRKEVEEIVSTNFYENKGMKFE